MATGTIQRRIVTPSAGMTRIRFGGSATATTFALSARSAPGSPVSVGGQPTGRDRALRVGHRRLAVHHDRSGVRETMGRQEWQDAYDASPKRDADFETMSGIPLAPLYAPAAEADLPAEIGWPGQYPYTRGVHPSMYRGRLWTMRMFAGFGTADGHQPALQGDPALPAATGCRPPSTCRPSWAATPTTRSPLGEVGKCGVAVDTLADMDDLFAGIDLGEVTTSMTINSPAAIMLAMYVAIAEDARAPSRARLGGTLQNDILKEYQAQKEFIFPPRPSHAAGRRHRSRSRTAEMPRWNPVSISGYHIREAGSTAAAGAGLHAGQRLRLRRGGHGGRASTSTSSRRACQLLLQRPHRLLRGDRQVPRRPPHLGPLDARALRRHRRAVADAALPHPDRRRVAHRPAARDQHRPHRHPGAGRRAGRHAEPAHQLHATRRWPCPPRRRPASRCAPSRSSPTRPASPTWPTRSAARGSSRG